VLQELGLVLLEQLPASSWTGRFAHRGCGDRHMDAVFLLDGLRQRHERPFAPKAAQDDHRPGRLPGDAVQMDVRDPAKRIALTTDHPLCRPAPSGFNRR
jgi:hypothetical protein